VTNVPPNCTVVGIPGRIVVRGGERVETIDLHHEDLPDPVVEMFGSLQRRIDRIELRLGHDEGMLAERGLPLELELADSTSSVVVSAEAVYVGDTVPPDADADSNPRQSSHESDSESPDAP